ncbi:MAG: hypothetical protein ACTHJ8_02040 [Mucilaginibacter sp.]
MINPAIIQITHSDGVNWNIIIEPILKRSNREPVDIHCYKLYKSSTDNQSALSTEPRELDEQNDDLDDSKNPDYLGQIKPGAGRSLHYEGNLLNDEQQKQVIDYIQRQI